MSQRMVEGAAPSAAGCGAGRRRSGDALMRRTPRENVYAIAEQDVLALGIEHLASHTGINTLGFRACHEQRRDARFARQAGEIPPPPLE